MNQATFQMRSRTASRFLAVTFLAVMAGSSSMAAEKSAGWSQFLGPSRNGISAETGLIDTFPESGPKELWRVPGGVGMSGMAVGQGKVVTMVQQTGQQWVIALDSKTGKTLWRKSVAPAYSNTMGNGPRATPAVVGDSVYAFTGEGILVALKFKDGTILWSHNILKELGGAIADYGMACSPLVVGDVVIITPGATGAAVVAYNKLSTDIGRYGNRLETFAGEFSAILSRQLEERS